MRYFLYNLFLFLTFIFHANAQLKWTLADSAYGKLPPSLHVYKSQASGGLLKAYYVSANIADRNLTFTTAVSNGEAYAPWQYFLKEDSPLLVVNGGFYSFEDFENLSMVMKNGRLVARNVVSLRGTGADSLLYYYPTRCAIGINRKRKAHLAWIFNDTLHHRPYAFSDVPVVAKGKQQMPAIYDLRDVNWTWWEMRTAIGGGPCLVHKGKLFITNKQEQVYVGEENERTARTAIGFTNDERLIILVIEGNSEGSVGANLLEEANLMKSLGCIEAINLNGGSNSCMLVNGKQTITPFWKKGQRPIPAVFLIKHTVISE